MTDVTVACVYMSPKVYGRKGPNYYRAEYVEKLKRGFERHMPVPHKFVCLTNEPFADYCIPLQHNWPGWWSKIELFTPGLLTGRVISVDLDTVLLGDLSFLLEHDSRFVMMDDRNHPGPNSCLMYWDNDMSHIYNKFCLLPDTFMAHYDGRETGSMMGDQGFIQKTHRENGGTIDLWQKVTSPSYFVNFSGIRNAPDWRAVCPNARICWWTGHPKPAQVNDPIVKENWI